MVAAKQRDEIIALFYASAAGEIPWATPLEILASQFGSSASLLGLHDSFFEVLGMESHNYTQPFLSDFFSSDIYRNDPRIAYLDRIPNGQIYYDEMLYDVREMEREPWVKASIDALGVFDQVGARLRLPNQRFISLGLLRTPSEGRISTSGVRAFRRLVPAIEQACALGFVVGSASLTQEVLLDAIAAKADAIILLDRAGSPIFINDAARHILSSADGLAIRDGAFLTRRPPETRTFTRLVTETLQAFRHSGQTPGGQMLVTRPSGAHPFVVRVAPAPQRQSFLVGRSIACIVYIQDLAASRIPSRRNLQELFGFTNREGDLAIELARTPQLERAARRCGMAHNTARNHLQSIFRKADVANQAEAVQLFSRLAS